MAHLESTISFIPTDDSISAASTSDVQDRLSALELRVQQQEDEITVLKAALADVVRRLAISEDHVASVRKSAPSKGKTALLRISFSFKIKCVSPMCYALVKLIRLTN